MGPWTRYAGNPVLKRTERVSGPGHNGVVQSPDGSELFVVYHTHQSAAAGAARQLAIDRMTFEDSQDGPDIIRVKGPTSSPQPLPSGAPAIRCAASDDFSAPELNRSQW